MLGTALGAVLTLGYGRGAYGQQVCLGGPPNFTCAGPSTDQQFLDVFGNNLNATALPGFQVNTTDASGLRFITTFGDLTFTDHAGGSTIVADSYGMYLEADIGSLTVTANGIVTGTTNSGIRAVIRDGDPTQALTVTTGAISTVTGRDYGMRLRQSGLGALTVTANGGVNGTGLYSIGIDARIVESTNASALSVATGAGRSVVGGRVGIDARQQGTGALTVTVSGNVTATESISYGVDAIVFNASNASDLTVTTDIGSDISARLVGLRATHAGTGAVTVTANGVVRGYGGVAVGLEARIVNTASTAAVSVTTGAGSRILGTDDGISAVQNGLGALTVTNGYITRGYNTSGTGLRARILNTDSTATLTVTTEANSDVAGGATGILAQHAGSGAINVTANGLVVASTSGSTGIVAEATSLTGTGALTVTTGAASDISGGTLGIHALHAGLGTVEVAVGGRVAATDPLASTGVYARITNASNAAALTVTTAAGSDVSGDNRGIVARHQGTGALTVTADGAVTGTNATGLRAHVDNLVSTGTLSVTTGAASDITGHDRGIVALHDGLGAVGVTVNGAVEGTATTSAGVYARAYNSANAAALTVATGAGSTVTGQLNGVYSRHDGTGAHQVTVDGTVTATGGNSIGLQAQSTNTASTAALTVTTGAGSSVTGRIRGIQARQDGLGALTATINGDVEATQALFTGLVLRVDNADNAAALTLTTGAGSTVTGTYRGIYALHAGTGAHQITINGTVTATDAASSGIVARSNLGTGTGALSVTTGAGSSITGQIGGIRATQDGLGALTATINGDVEATGAQSIGLAALASNSGNAAALTVTTGVDSRIEGGSFGIYAQHEGTGALSVTVDGEVTARSIGLRAQIDTGSGQGALTVTTGADSRIEGGFRGVSAVQYGRGATTVTIAGQVEATDPYSVGLLAMNSFPNPLFTTNAAPLTVTTLAGSRIVGGGSGLNAIHSGFGAVTVTVGGEVRGTDASSSGLFAVSSNSNSGASLTVTTETDSRIEAGRYGIAAHHFGTGTLDLTVDGQVAGMQPDSTGVRARIYNSANNQALSVTTGAASSVTAVRFGVYSRHDGTGTHGVTVDGTVSATGPNSRGVYARSYNAANASALTVTTGADSQISGDFSGLDARHEGTGALTVTINGTSTGLSTTSDGVFARAASTNTSAMNVATGADADISGGRNGLRAFQQGTGALTVTIAGQIEGREANGSGVLARIFTNLNSSTLTVTTLAGSSVSGGFRGVYALNQGLGATVLTIDGTIQGTAANSAGIYARASSVLSAAAIGITTVAGSSVSGGAYGIDVQHDGLGAMNVTANGTVTATSGDSIGIYALLLNPASTAALTITTGADSTVTGDYAGIQAQQYGMGDLSVAVAGAVQGTSDVGILAEIYGATGTGALSVTTAAGSTVSGALAGIGAIQGGTGSLSVTVDGSVTGTAAVGIGAVIDLDTNAAALTVTTGAGSTITGGALGLYAVHTGLGSVSVTVDGTVAGAGLFGVGAIIGEPTSAADVTVTTGAGSAVTGAITGIAAQQFGLGAIVVSVDGTVEGVDFAGIAAPSYNPDAIGAVTITSSTGSRITGGAYGITAEQNGLGALDITVGGTVEAGALGVGIAALIDNAASAAALTVTSGAGSEIRSGGTGILASHFGSGDLSVDLGANSLLEGEQNGGLVAQQYGQGALTVALGAGGRVSSTSAGITATSYGNSPLRITTGAGSTVDGGFLGIQADMNGLGALEIALDGRIEAAGSAGVAASINTPGSAAALDIDLGAGAEVIVQVGAGITGNHSGTGDLSVTTAQGSRIDAAQPGIWARHFGTGAVGVSVGGIVTSSDSDGILARIGSYTSAGMLSVTTGADSVVMGAGYGILARHEGLGAIEVTVAGSVSSSGSSGIGLQMELATSAAALSVTTAAGSSVSGRYDAIYARQTGTGALSVTANGLVSANDDAGIDAFIGNGTSGAGLSVTTGAGSRVQGGARGILALHLGMGALTVTAGGEVLGTALDSEGIDAWIFSAGSAAALTVQTGEGSAVSGGADGILARHAGSGAVSVSVGGVVIGGTGAAIRTQAQAASGQAITVAATGAVVGGAGQAIVAEGAAVTIENFGQITGGVTLTGAADLFGNAGTWVVAGQTAAFGSGDDRVENRGTLVAGTAGISVLSTAAALPASAQTTVLQGLETFVNLGGLIQMQNGVSGDVLEISGAFVADGGVLALDVQVAGTASTADRLVIGGEVQRAGAATGIHVTQTAAAGDRDDDGILVVQVAGASASDAFTLANPAPLELGAFVYELTQGACGGAGGGDWYLCPTDQPGSIATLYEAAPAVLLGGFATLPSLFERLRQRQPTGADVEATRGPSILPGPDSRFGGVWMRLHGERADIAPRVSTAGATFRRSTWGLQLGADLLVAEGEGGDWVLGATAQYGRVSATVRNAVGTGQITGQGWGIGFTATWQGVGGTYVDLQGQANRVSVDYATAAQGLLASNVTARTQALSAEIGHRHAVSPGLTLVPQAQLAWGSVDGGSFTDAVGNAVVLGRGSTTSGRIGLAWEYSPSGTGPEAPLVYGILNIRHDFSAPAAVSVAGTPLVTRLHPTQGEIGLGGVLPLSANAVLFGQASYRAPFGSAAGNRAVAASAGLRIRW